MSAAQVLDWLLEKHSVSSVTPPPEGTPWIGQGRRKTGAGIIFLTSKACDGAKTGYDVPLIRAIKDCVKVPVVASGGAGTMEQFYEVAQNGGADILLAASVFRFGEIKIFDLKRCLRERGLLKQ